MLIDLTVLLSEKTPTYPGDPETKINPAAILVQHGYNDHVISLGTHVGTHIDAPSHMIAGGKDLGAFPIEKFSGSGVYIKVEEEFNLEQIKKSPINEGDIVLFHTGMSEKYYEPAYFEEYPLISEEIAQYLVSKKIKIVGMDMCSPDKAPFHVHKILLGSDVLIIENLTNLEALENKEFKIYAFPIKLDLDAAPVRVVAEII